MRVILKQSVPKVGKEGQVVSVKPGFARNFLFPQGMAIVADKAQLKALEIRNSRIAQQLEDTKSGAEQQAEKLNGKSVRIQAKAGELGRLFGAVTSQDVADAIKQDLGVELEKKQVGLLQPIKRLGTFSIEIDLHRLVDCEVNVEVFDPEYIGVEEERMEELDEVLAEDEAEKEAALQATIEASSEAAPEEEAAAEESEEEAN